MAIDGPIHCRKAKNRLFSFGKSEKQRFSAGDPGSPLHSEFHAPGGRWQRKNLPIEVKFSRRVVEDADPYGVRFDM